MSKYDYFVAGRWRNREQVEHVMSALKKAGYKVYCFIENGYEGDGVALKTDPDVDVEKMMTQIEQLDDWRTNPTFRKIFESDINAEINSEAFIVVFPIGFSAHMELGVAYGLGKKCYGIGQPEKAETLYLMLDDLFPDIESFIKAKAKVKV